MKLLNAMWGVRPTNWAAGEVVPNTAKELLAALASNRALAPDADETHQAVAEPAQRAAPGGIKTGKHQLDRFDDIIRKYAEKYGVPASVAKAVMVIESSGRVNAVSGADALGLMQLLLSTARDYERGVTRNALLTEPETNLRIGLRHLARLWKKFDGDLDSVFASYNAGEGAVQRFGGVPPYRETQQYVLKAQRELDALA